ncbi:GroES-like protein [Suillus decipiens]|nr:GroES-like protein [Suillus decipiens]
MTICNLNSVQWRWGLLINDSFPVHSTFEHLATIIMSNIPKTQIAAVVPYRGAALEIQNDHPVKQPSELAPGECLVKLFCTGVCHSDLHVSKDDWPLHANTPLVGGHEGVEEVVAIGENTGRCPVKIGDRFGIKLIAYSCLNCEQCRNGREQNCPKAKLSDITIDGTFAQYTVSYVHHVTPIPKNIDSNAAASIFCAGVTVYRALKYSHAKIGEWVVLPGAGGGLGHLAIQYAVAMGFRVVAIDTGLEKKKLASGYTQAVEYLRPGGTLMALGLPGEAKLEASIFFIVFKSINIIGSCVGNRQDVIEALDIASRGRVVVRYECKGLSELKKAYNALEQGKVAERVVLEMSH